MLISKSSPSFGAFLCRGARMWQAGQPSQLCSAGSRGPPQPAQPSVQAGLRATLTQL